MDVMGTFVMSHYAVNEGGCPDRDEAEDVRHIGSDRGLLSAAREVRRLLRHHARRLAEGLTAEENREGTH